MYSMTKINICTFKSDKACRLGIRQEISVYLGLTNPALLEHVRINEILRYWNIYKYYYMKKTLKLVGVNKSYRTVWNQCCLSPWVGQTHKSSESEIVMMNSSEMNTGLRPSLPLGGRPSACIYLLGIHHDKL